MPYAILTTDPEVQQLGGDLPLGFNVLPWERDGVSGPEAIWIVTHADDTTLVNELSGRGLALDEHEAVGTWMGTEIVVSIPGDKMVQLRALMGSMAVGLPAVAPAIRPGLQAILDAMAACLPTDPRA